MARNGVEVALDREAPLEVRVLGRRVGKEVDRPVLEPLIDGESQQGAVLHAVLVEDPV